MNDDEMQPSTRVEPPIAYEPTPFERAAAGAVDYWRDEARWWQRFALVGYGLATAELIYIVARWVL